MLTPLYELGPSRRRTWLLISPDFSSASLPDAFEPGPLLALVFVPVAYVALVAFPDEGGNSSAAFGVAYAILVVWIVLFAIVATVKGVFFAWRRRWRRCASMLLLPALVVLSLPWAPQWVGVLTSAGHQIHLYMMREAYLAQIAHLPATPGPRLAYFVWSRGLLSGLDGVAYDDSDQLQLPPSQRDNEWSRTAERAGIECKDLDSHPGSFYVPMGDHFYYFYWNC